MNLRPNSVTGLKIHFRKGWRPRALGAGDEAAPENTLPGRKGREGICEEWSTRLVTGNSKQGLSGAIGECTCTIYCKHVSPK